MNSWLDAGKSDLASYYIHPTGKSKDAYFFSGLEAAKKIKNLLPADAIDIMEYGCGNGRILTHLKDYKTVGVDIVPEFVYECNAKHIEAHVIKDYPFEPVFDVVFAYTVFIHLNKSDAKEALKNIYKSLKPGGLALVQVPIYDFNNDPTNWIDVGTWNQELFKLIVEGVGFKIIQMHKNPGRFSYKNIGKNHDEFQILKKC